MNLSHVVVLGIFSTFVLSACQPTYTVEQTQFYARSIGVTNQFDIRRGNSRIITANTRLCILSEYHKIVDNSELNNAFSKGLSPFFQQVSTAKPVNSIALAAKAARESNAHFAIFIRVVDTKTLYGQEQASASGDFHRLRLLVTVVDATSEKVMDKIQLLAKSPHFSLIGRDVSSLLAKPIEYIGHDLSGV